MLSPNTYNTLPSCRRRRRLRNCPNSGRLPCDPTSTETTLSSSVSTICEIHPSTFPCPWAKKKRFAIGAAALPFPLPTKSCHHSSPIATQPSTSFALPGRIVVSRAGGVNAAITIREYAILCSHTDASTQQTVLFSVYTSHTLVSCILYR